MRKSDKKSMDILLSNNFLKKTSRTSSSLMRLIAFALSKSLFAFANSVNAGTDDVPVLYEKRY